MRRIIQILILTLIAGAFNLAHAQRVNVQANATPQIHLGQMGAYEIQLQSTEIDPQIPPPQIPQVKGLEIKFEQSSTPRRFIQIYNGRKSFDITQAYSYSIKAEAQGRYTIPSFDIQIEGNKVTIPATTIEVLEPLAKPELNFELILPRENIYVGEAVKATVKLSFDAQQMGVRAANSSQLFSVTQGDAFTIGNFQDKTPRRYSDGAALIQEHTWEVMITPLKSGPQPMVLQMDLIVFTQSQRLFQQYDTQRVTLYTDDGNINILPLPPEGQPSDFTGGIGAFSVDEPKLSTKQVMAGEPLTLTLTVRGQGNFSRLQPPSIDEGDVWRAYPPEEEFFPADQLGYSGQKVFEYTLIPLEAGNLRTPEVHFNFFDPESSKYVEMPIPGQAISVQVNPNAQRPPPKKPVTARRGPELLPIAMTPGNWVSSIRPIITHPLFLSAQLVPALLIGLAIKRRRHELKLQNDPIFARHLRSSQQIRIEMNNAHASAKQSDAVAFYAAAQRGVQAAAGCHVSQAPESLTVADIVKVGQRLHVNEGTLSDAQSFIEAGDAVRFGGVNTRKVDFNQELNRLESVVRAFGGKQ